MVSRFHDRFGTAGLVVAVIALIVVLGGTAFAASGGLSGRQKQEVKKIAKGFQGAGPAGPMGPAGANGVNGKNGINGKEGATGPPGPPGASVISEPVAPGADCEAGGYSFQVEDTSEVNFVCNGADGAGGGGSTSGAVLAPGETETGVWAVRGQGMDYYRLVISFPLRIVPHPTGRLEPSEDPVHCSGSAAKPTAAPGYFCLYKTKFANAFIGFNETPDPTSGEIYEVKPKNPAEPVDGFGTWAATAKLEEEP